MLAIFLVKTHQQILSKMIQSYATVFPRHLLDIRSWTLSDICTLLNRADHYFYSSHSSIHDILQRKSVMSLFFEPSTRTQISFELAAKRLGSDFLNIDLSHSSTMKGESLSDTLKTIHAMSPDIVILRHPSSGFSHFIASKVNCSIINAE